MSRWVARSRRLRSLQRVLRATHRRGEKTGFGQGRHRPGKSPENVWILPLGQGETKAETAQCHHPRDTGSGDAAVLGSCAREHRTAPGPAGPPGRPTPPRSAPPQAAHGGRLGSPLALDPQGHPVDRQRRREQCHECGIEPHLRRQSRRHQPTDETASRSRDVSSKSVSGGLRRNGGISPRIQRYAVRHLSVGPLPISSRNPGGTVRSALPAFRGLAAKLFNAPNALAHRKTSAATSRSGSPRGAAAGRR